MKTLPTHCRNEAVLKQSFRVPESSGKLVKSKAVGVGQIEMGSLVDSLPRMYKAVGLNPVTSKMNEWRIFLASTWTVGVGTDAGLLF